MEGGVAWCVRCTIGVAGLRTATPWIWGTEVQPGIRFPCESGNAQQEYEQFGFEQFGLARLSWLCVMVDEGEVVPPGCMAHHWYQGGLRRRTSVIAFMLLHYVLNNNKLHGGVQSNA